MKIVESQLRAVGIGASAGGLEALQQFFKNIPENSGMAYIVIQHLSPDYKSLMDELLSRHTSMPIVVIEDGVKIEPDCVYLIPPRQNLKIYHNQLFLLKQDSSKGLNLPIDFFFKSLAEEKGKDAIGVILSGTGSDGTMGTRAIKEMNGIIMVQDEKTAKFNGMPSSAISTGLVDYVLPADKMGEELLNYIKHPLTKRDKSASLHTLKGIDALSKILMMIKDHSGIDFSFYKENTINRRLERRVSINRFNSIKDYIPFLSGSEKEREILYREFLIGVTHFFRDKEAFDSLGENVISRLVRNGKKQLRVWSTGCSTGEEAYSLAILFMEWAEKENFRGEIKIFATDIDRKSIEIAGRGFYPDSIVADVDPKLLQKYFHKTENGYKINEDIRNMIVFATHNILKDPPFSKLDLLVCRNLFIYFKPPIQAGLLSRFYYSLNPNGYLFMGNSETLGGMSEAFDVIELKSKIYQYKAGFNAPIIDGISLEIQKSKLERNHDSTIIPHKKGGLKPEDFLTSILGDFIPPSIVVDSNYFIVSVVNDINPFTEIQQGNYSNELFSILPKDLGLYINNLLRLLKNGKERTFSRVIHGLESMKNRTLKLEGRKLAYQNTLYYMISFLFVEAPATDEIAAAALKDDDFSAEQGLRVLELEKELKATKENLAATVEELESANEELQSSNEELIASNEELQSTNEELQSVNEELYSVNSEHQQKIEELMRLNNDVNNLLKNTEIAAVYLDSKLCIRKITPEVSRITHIREGDIGRPITHLTVLDNYSDFPADVDQVMNTLLPVDKEISFSNGKPYFTRIRPYRTENNAVDGVLITLIDISELKSLKKQFKQSSELLAISMNMAKMAWWEWNVLTNEVSYDDRKATMLGYTPEEFPKDVYEICSYIHPEDYSSTMAEMRKVLVGEKKWWDATYRMRRKDGSYIWYQDHGSIKTVGENGLPSKMIGLVIDVTSTKKLEDDLKKNESIVGLIVENSPLATTMVNNDGWISYANKKAEELFNISREQILSRTYNATGWKITGISGKPIPDEELPMNLIRKSGKPVFGFQHFIEIPERKKLLLTIDGAPVFGGDNDFFGAVFTIKSAAE